MHKKLLMANSCMKWGFKHTINEIILFLLLVMWEKRSLAKKVFCKTWKIFYDSLNFLRISFPDYICIIFWLQATTQKKQNMKLKQMWELMLFLSRVSKKVLTTNKSLKKYCEYSLFNRVSNINLTFTLLLFIYY